MNNEEYFSYDALGLSELLRTKQISSSELLEVSINLTELLDPLINAVPIRHFDLARDQAKENSIQGVFNCLLYTSPSPRDGLLSRMPSSA